MSEDPRIAELVQDFVTKITALAREAAVATLSAAFSSAPGQAAKAPRPAPPRKPVLAAPAAARSASRKKGTKRPAEEVQRLQTMLAKHIAANPGLRVEEINRALGTTTRDVARPLAKLLEAGSLKTKGQRRATAYFPA